MNFGTLYGFSHLGVKYGSGISTEAAAFLARTTGLDTAHTNAYVVLIDGMVADGVWAKLDVLHIYATQDSATAQLNLVSSSYPATVVGSPTFTVDRGYTGSNDSATVFISTGFNSAQAPSPKFKLSTGHLSAWAVTAGTSGQSIIGTRFLSNNSNIYTGLTGNAVFQINNAGFSGFANAVTTGHYISSRLSSAGIDGYKNGTSMGNIVDASTALQNGNIYAIATNLNNIAHGCDQQCAMVSIGLGLSSTDVTNFYNRLRVYMTAVGVP